jgi:hypothetical protein
MSSTTQITNTILKSPKISFEVKVDDYRYVKATKKINAGELLLIEHCYSCSKENVSHMIKVVQLSSELFNNLYPRTIEWDESICYNSPDEIMNLCQEKCQKNCFGRNNKIILGLDISKFNHSTSPNCDVKEQVFTLELEVDCSLMYVYSNKNIDVDEEITMWYGNGYFQEKIEITPEFEFKCNLIIEVAKQYMRKEIFKTIAFNHVCMHYGVHNVKNDLIIFEPRFMRYLADKVEKEFNKENWIQWVIEKWSNFTSHIDTITAVEVSVNIIIL